MHAEQTTGCCPPAKEINRLQDGSAIGGVGGRRSHANRERFQGYPIHPLSVQVLIAATYTRRVHRIFLVMRFSILYSVQELLF